MSKLLLRVLSMRYSSWSMRAWLALTHAGADFSIETVDLPRLSRQKVTTSGAIDAEVAADDLDSRRKKGSITGLFPVLSVDGIPIHESLAIGEWAAETYPEARLWPEDPLDRARARAVCCEMVSGFHNVRADMSCHLFARVPDFELRQETRAEVSRIFEIWRELLDRHGGPLLTGTFGLPDCMYFPVLSRFRTYGVELPDDLERYAKEIEASAPVGALVQLARKAPRLLPYDEYIQGLGGDPDAALED